MDDFVRCAELLASPGTEPALRAQADAWLAAFRGEPAAWGVALAVLQAAAAPPEVRLQAASLLAWKAKRQLAQLQPVERQAELAEALTALAAAPAPQGGVRDMAVGGVCLSLANLAIHCSAWARPLDTLGPRLSQERMLEFLTLLPQECEDAAAAAQSASAELAWGLKARAHEWSPEVAAWLWTLHSSGGTGSSGSFSSGVGSPGGPPSPAQQAPQQPQLGLLLQEEGWQHLTLSVLRCFGAWVKWGCLQYIDPRHASYFASLAGELLFAADPARGLPYHPACLPAAVDAATELIEHATEALQPLLLQLAAALPARATALRAADGEAAAEELCHVFALFCSTHCELTAAEGPEGQALRQGLLQMLALPIKAGSDTGGAALPALGALSDVLEHVLAQQRGERGAEDQEAGGVHAAGTRPMAPGARREFAAAALEVLLAQVQPYAAAFQPPSVAAPSAPVQRSTHSPEGVPDALRQEAAAVVDTLGDLLGVDAVVRMLAAHAEGALQQHGVHSVAAQAALDSALFVLGSMSGLLEACCSERSRQDPLPDWLAGFLRLYSLVPEVDGSRQAGADSAPLTILHADLLSSFWVLGHLVMPLLLQAVQQQHQQALFQLVLSQALRALSSPHKTPDVAAGSTEDVVERGAHAIRILCSCATSSALPTSQQLLAGVQQGMVLLQQPQQYQQYQEAHSQLVTGLVHALHGIPPGDAQMRAVAESTVQQHIFAPLAVSVQEVLGPSAAMAAAGGAAAAGAGHQLRAALWRLTAALRQFHALLNALESHSWYDAAGSTSSGGMAGSGGQQEVARGVTQAAVAAFLSCWPRLADVCCSWQGLPSGASLATLRRELYQEAAHCICSCIALEREAFQQVLPSFAEAAAACFFQPGAAVLHRPLIQAIERYGPLLPYQQPLLSTVASILSAPQAQQLALLRGGDADPEAAQAALALLGCCLRQAGRWRQAAAPQPAAVEALLRLGLPLAVANAACHHRDTSYQAVATLSALLALVLERDSPLHGMLLGFAGQQGPLLLQGLLLALLSLNSGSHLPKVVSLMSDTALLAASLALAQLQQQGAGVSPEAVCSLAASQLGAWLAAARQSVTQSGILSEQAMAALLAQWDWQPVLQQAGLQLAHQQHGGGGSTRSPTANGANTAEVRRATQRMVRQLADLIRRTAASPLAMA